MKRKVLWMHLPYTVFLVSQILNYMVVDGLPATELWRPELMDELTVDEWPIDDEDGIINDNSDSLNSIGIDERIYEMEAQLVEQREQIMVDGINVTGGISDDDEEEEDDVDQDDYEDEDSDDDGDGDDGDIKAKDQEAMDMPKRLEADQLFGNKINDHSNDESITSTMYQKDNDAILIPAAATPPTLSSPRATSKLQLQEELDLEVLDQSIVDILRSAFDTVKQDRAQRFIPLDEVASAATGAPVESQTSSPSLPVSLFLASGFHVSVSWSSYWILGGLLCLIIFSYRRFRQQPIREHHHLPSYSVYKQKSSVD